jgi:hypothetical protein
LIKVVIAVNGDACDPLSFVSHTTKVRGEGRGEEEEEGVGEGCAGRMGGMEGRGSEGREEEREGEEEEGEGEEREKRREEGEAVLLLVVLLWWSW